MSEEWRTTKYTPRYEVSSLGRIRMVGRPPRKVTIRKNGYAFVTLWIGDKLVSLNVARLVLEAFHGPAPAGTEASHVDGRPANCRADNLEWDTHAGNCARRIEHGTNMPGEENPAAVLTEAKVAELRASPLGSRKLAPLYGVSDTHVRRIRRGENW